MLVKRRGTCRLCGGTGVVIANTDNGLVGFTHTCKHTHETFNERTIDASTLFKDFKGEDMNAAELMVVTQIYKSRLKVDKEKSVQLEIVHLIEQDIF